MRRLPGEVGHGLEEAVHVGPVVVVHQARPDRAARVADTEDAGPLPGAFPPVSLSPRSS